MFAWNKYRILGIFQPQFWLLALVLASRDIAEQLLKKHK